MDSGKTAVPFPVLIKGWLFPAGSDTGTCLTAFVARPGGEVGGCLPSHGPGIVTIAQLVEHSAKAGKASA